VIIQPVGAFSFMVALPFVNDFTLTLKSFATPLLNTKSFSCELATA